MRRQSAWAAAAAAGLVALGVGAALTLSRPRPVPRAVEPPGRRKQLKSRLLERGARLLQGNWPMAGFQIYMVGFHPMKQNPAHQMEAHHFCRQVNEDFMECVLFDGNRADANLVGIEYIISERLFEGLPQAERGYWHPHNGEILSGQLVAPGLPLLAEHEFMRSKMNSYGKTWHLWDTGSRQQPGDALPMGEPHLAWSFSRLGEAREELISIRDRALGLDSEARRRSRQDLLAEAHPQEGVDALRGCFPGATSDLAGVRDKVSAPTGVPLSPQAPPNIPLL